MDDCARFLWKVFFTKSIIVTSDSFQSPQFNYFTRTDKFKVTKK